LPLQVFGKGSLFGPYTPLQQLDLLADKETKSYVVGSTNSLLLQQKDRYSDILINLDEDTITISPQPLRALLTLTVPDRRWIDFLTQTVNDTWDEANPGRPNTLGYAGSEEFIRLQFEEYILALLSAVKYRLYVEGHKDDPKALLSEVDGDPANEFSDEWVKAWMKTENFRIFNKFTDSHIFDIVEPKHPCTGGLTIEDVQRRLAQQVSELHLDERFQSGREVIGKHLATGQKKVSTAFNSLWADMEAMREAQRQRALEQKEAGASADGKQAAPNGRPAVKFPKAPDLSQAQASVAAAGQKAGAYFSSWGSWASEKRKTGWRSTSATVTPVASPTLDLKMKHESSAASSWTQVSIPSPENKHNDERVDVAVSPSTPEKKIEAKELPSQLSKKVEEIENSAVHRTEASVPTPAESKKVEATENSTVHHPEASVSAPAESKKDVIADKNIPIAPVPLTEPKKDEVIALTTLPSEPKVPATTTETNKDEMTEIAL
jgi:hypothetical protein